MVELTHPEMPAPPDEQIEDWPAYNERKSRKQLEWKPRILLRDAYRCRWCGIDMTGEPLELAHVTDCKDFYLARHKLEDLDASYSDDNLVILCHTCHKAQTGTLKSLYSPELKRLFDVRQRLKDDPDVKDYFRLVTHPRVREFIDVSNRIDPLLAENQRRAEQLRKDVQGLMDGVKEKRGWKHAAERLLPSTGTSPQAGPKVGIRQWMLHGYLPVRVCRWPRDEKELERYGRSECVVGVNCEGVVAGCLVCHITYCDKHDNEGHHVK